MLNEYKESSRQSMLLALNSHGNPDETCDLVEFKIKRDLPVS